MESEKDVNLMAYPAYVHSPSPGSNGSNAAHPAVFKAEVQARFDAIMENPTFLHIKDFILPGPEQPDAKNSVLASPLITWARASENVGKSELKEYCGPLLSPAVVDFMASSMVKFVTYKLSLVDGTYVAIDIAPVLTMLPLADSAPIVLKTCLATVCGLFSNIYHEKVLQHPGMVIRLPFAELRVRDIVLYRFFQEMLAKANLSNIKVRTDTVQRPHSKEAINEPLLTFCATCMKIDFNYQRCSGCIVAFFCSPECQKKGWKVHKTE